MKKRIAIGVFLLLLLVGFFIGKPYYHLHFDVISLEEDEKMIFIATGASLDDLGEMLAQVGVLDKADFLEFAEKLDFTSDKVEPGKYLVKKGMKIKNLIYGLKNGNQEIKDVRITFNNCRDIYDMAGKVAPYIEADSTQLVGFILAPQTLEKFGFKPHTITALFLPDTYEVGEWDMTAEEFVDRMADEYKKFWTDERKTKAENLNLQQSQVATLASIVEAEQGINSQEWETISGLYLNRLRIGMLLQSDPTAKFCWGDELEGVQRLLTVHMEIDCPYNTYKYTGLPPGPIRMASKKAMDAVLNAEKNDYLFMCARPDNSGLHNFAATYNQHLANARKFQAYLRSIGL